MGAIVMSAVLVVVAALAVDLGKAWTTKLSVQKSVDVTALSAGALLPAPTEVEKGLIYQEVADYLNKPGNKVAGQTVIVLASQLHDTIVQNGEIYFTTNPSTNVVDTMRVVAPAADVDFAFAGALGIDDVNVTSEATVKVRTPLPSMESVLPIWLPSTCVYGALAADAGSNPPPNASPAYTLNQPVGGSSWRVATVNPSTAVYASRDVELTLTIDNLPAGKLGAVIRLTFGDTQHVDHRVTWSDPVY